MKKAVPPPEPPRDPRLVALAEQAQRAGWKVEWQPAEFAAQWWLRIQYRGVRVDALVEEGGCMTCYAQYIHYWRSPARTPTEALRAAYAALGVALDQAEDAFGQEQGQGEVE